MSLDWTARERTGKRFGGTASGVARWPVTMRTLVGITRCARLLELCPTPPAVRIAGLVSTLAMLLVALLLVFSREANVMVLAEGPVAAARARQRR